MTTPKTITAEELDEKFDNGEDISAYVDWSKLRRPNQEARLAKTESGQKTQNPRRAKGEGSNEQQW